MIQGRNGSRTVTGEIAFRFLVCVQLFQGLFLGLLALTPCLFLRSNVPHSTAQCFNCPTDLNQEQEEQSKTAIRLMTVVALRLVTGLTTTMER